MQPSPPPSPNSSPAFSLASLSTTESSTGKVRLHQCNVSDHYRMGKVMAKGDDWLIVEGQHLATQQSHALKLLSKRSNRFEPTTGLKGRNYSHLLSQCVEELYEGPNHVCMVMRWGTHELDEHHELAAAVLEALRLLRELLPPSSLPREGLMLQKADARRLMLRALALDRHLQSNLFI